MEEYIVKEIGKIQVEKDDFKITLDKKYIEGLTALKDFDYVMIIWWFNEVDNEEMRDSVIVNKPYIKGPDTLGVFATRSPIRPNPIAVTTAKILYIDEEKVEVHISYIDAFDGSPVLDIKPYTPSLDRVENTSSPQWCKHWPNCLEESGEFNWEEEFNF